MEHVSGATDATIDSSEKELQTQQPRSNLRRSRAQLQQLLARTMQTQATVNRSDGQLKMRHYGASPVHLVRTVVVVFETKLMTRIHLFNLTSLFQSNYAAL